MKIRIKFTKNECVKYLGHLDIMRAVQKAFNRAGIKIAYSGGFNPHQKMSFAQPLGVGVTSDGDYLEAEIADPQTEDHITYLEQLRGRLDEALMPAFHIFSIREMEPGAEKSMAAVWAADYIVSVYGLFVSSKHIANLLDRPEIIVEKKTKSGISTLDIKPYVFTLQLRANGSEGCEDEPCVMMMRLKAGSENNIKPELVLDALCAANGMSYDKDNVRVHRLELLGRNFFPLESYQTMPVWYKE